ncbi:MAG: NAD-dependent epimerase/dehydratase family protein [bacterium]
MKRALITGGTGFVGANLARRLVRDGHEVHLLVRQGHKTWRIEEIRDSLRLHVVDLLDEESVARLVKSIRPEWVFHLATHGAYSYQTDRAQIIRTNFIATVNLINACLKTGFEAFVNTGTSSEYGFKDHAPAENEYLEPNSYYAVAKASATLFARFTAQSLKAHIPTLRLYSVYGPFEEPGRLIPTLIVRGLAGELPFLVDPSIARDYVFVDDVTEAFLLAASQPNQEPGAIYNVGTGAQTTLSEVVAIARRLMNIPAQPQWGSMPNRSWDTSVWVADNRKIRTTLGWQPKHSFEQGLRATIEWFQSCPSIQSVYSDSPRSS